MEKDTEICIWFVTWFALVSSVLLLIGSPEKKNKDGDL